MSDRKTMEQANNRTCFEMSGEVREFCSAFQDLLYRLGKASMQDTVSDRNMMKYKHGRRWSHRANPESSETNMQQCSAHASVKYEDITNHNVGKLREILRSLVEEFQGQMMRTLYKVISDTCDQTGNTVSAKELGFPQAFLEMMRKIELGVDENGKVPMPQMHIAPGSNVVQLLEAQSEEFHQEFEAIKATKIAVALEREAQRKARFKRRSSE